MSEEILINVTPSETRVALVENGMLQEVAIERSRQRGQVGNIYKGRVCRVLPGMQAAFVDIGLERAAFLHLTDIVDGQSANGNSGAKEPDITLLLSEGKSVIVQVVKGPIGGKGARLTTNLSIPSRYLVLLPEGEHIGISTRIDDVAARDRLRDAIDELRPPDSTHGYIVRTNAEYAGREALASDMAFLEKLWTCVQSQIDKVEASTCIYEDLRLSRKALRDIMGPNVEKVRIDSRETHDRTINFAKQFLPDKMSRIEHYPGERPIFDLYGVEDEIQRALERTSPLKSGGHIVIDQTEAMTTIDVNTGGFVGHRNLEETIFKTNLEAAQAIARQLRLRNLGGIIIIDFIDMQDEEHKRQVLRTLEKGLARDSAKTNVCSISSLGLVEMTRKRTTDSLGGLLCEPCPCCSGRGTLKTAETVCYEIFREVMRAVRQFDAEKLLVIGAPDVVDRILSEESTSVMALEGFIQKSIRFQPDEQYGQEQYDVVLL